MSAYQELFALVKSLSKREHKALTLHIERIGGTNTDYNQVLELLRKQKKADESGLSAALSETVVRRLPTIQTRLMSLIATVLVGVHEDLRPIKVDMAIQKGRILLYKGHHKLATKVLNKAIKVAEEHHMYAKLIQLYSLKMDAFRSVKHIPGDTYANNKEILARQGEIIQYLQDYNTLYEFFFEKVVAPVAYTRATNSVADWRALLEEPLLGKSYPKQDIRSRMMRLNILMVIAVRGHESELAAQCIEDTVYLVHESQAFSLMFANSYSQNLVGLIEIQLDENREYEKAAANIQHLKDFATRISKSDHLPSVQQYYKTYANAFAMVFEQRLELCMRKPPTPDQQAQLLRELENAKEMIPSAMKSLKRYVSLLSIQVELVEGRLHAAKKQAAELLQDGEQGSIDDFQKVAVFIQSLIAIIEEDWEFAESLLQKVHRWEGKPEEEVWLKSLRKAVQLGGVGIRDMMSRFTFEQGEVDPVWVREIDIAYVLTQWYKGSQ